MQKQPQDNELLTIDEVAARLRLSRSGVRNLIAQGSLPFIDLCTGTKRVPRIRRSDIEEFIQGRLSAGVKR